MGKIKFNPTSSAEDWVFLFKKKVKNMKILQTIKQALLISVIIFQNLYSTEQAADSVKTYYLEPYFISSTRSEILIGESPVYANIVTNEQIKNINGTNLGDILQTQGGIFVKDYGSMNGLKTISLRGMSSENTLILINSSRINNYQNGIVDLSLIPLENIERIEIVHGGLSSLYGADASGGVVNIITKDIKDELKIKLTGSAGSFGYGKYSLGLSNRFDNLGISGFISHEKGSNNYTYSNPLTGNGKIKKRENSDFKTEQINLSSTYKMSSTELKLNNLYTRSARGTPGNLMYPSLFARQSDDIISSQLTAINNSFDKLSIKNIISFYFSEYDYVDPSFLVDSYSRNLQYSINPQVDYIINDQVNLVIGGEITQAQVSGNDYPANVNSSQSGIYATGNISFQFENNILDEIIFYPSLRYDHYSDIDGEFNPNIGINASFFDKINYRINYGTNFRMPTLNELHFRDIWGNSGNSELLPEYSKVFETGFNTKINIFGMMRISVSYFNVMTKNKIIWIPADDWTYSPVNQGLIYSTGFLFNVNYRIGQLIDLDLAHTINAAKNRSGIKGESMYNKYLIYSPRDITKIGARFSYGIISLGLDNIWVSKSYTNNLNTKAIPAYAVTNINIIVKQIIGKVSAKIEFDNLFNKSYQIIEHYPMPLDYKKLTVFYEY